MDNLGTDGLSFLLAPKESLRLRVWHLMVSHGGSALVGGDLANLVLVRAWTERRHHLPARHGRDCDGGGWLAKG